jgi:hypothetical protein
MTDKIKSLDQDFIFGEIDIEAMLRAEIERLTAENERLRAARDATIRTLGDSRTPLQSRVNDAIGILARTP